MRRSGLALLGARAHDLAPGSYVVLSVTDSGHGMDAATRAQIFEPFFTTKEVGKGTGLGLATVYGIVKQSGGFIEVESERGPGASFKVYLPRVEEAVAAPEAGKSSPGTRPRASEPVLLVEDDESLRMLAREILTVQGYAAIEAASPQDALRTHQAHEDRIDLLLTDVVMPEMNGRQLATSSRPRARRWRCCSCPATPARPFAREAGSPSLPGRSCRSPSRRTA